MSTSTTSPDALSDAKAHGRWLVITFGLLILIISVQFLVTWWLDPFGVFRNPAGRALLVSEDERRAKYLLNKEYVPANFNALIIGASASMSWRPNELTGYYFYNESVDGANAVEERKIVEQALAKGHFKVALVIVHPMFTSYNDMEDGLDQVSIVEALGSISSFGLEYEMLRDRIHPKEKLRFPDGRRIKPFNTHPKPEDTFTRYHAVNNPVSMGSYRAIVQELLDRQTKVIYVTYPLYGPFERINQDILDGYTKTIVETMPTAPMIDFNAPEYASFREDPANYMDKIHLSERGSVKLTKILNERIYAILDR